MKLLTRSTILVGVTALLLATGAGAARAIVGGQDATELSGEVALSITFPGLGTGYCGGFLPTSAEVITAAHCVSDQDAAPTPVAVPGASVTVRLGSLDRSSGAVLATGARVILHPEWQWASNPDPNAPVADIAKVVLDRPIFGVRLLPISGRQTAEGQGLRLVGWGLTQYPGTAADLPNRLQQRDTTRQPDAACAGGFLSAGEICTGPGACYGDSGSAALRQDRVDLFGRQRWWAVGIASRETDEQYPYAAPTVYTDAVAYTDWLLHGHTSPAQPNTLAPALITPDLRRRMQALKLPLAIGR